MHTSVESVVEGVGQLIRQATASSKRITLRLMASDGWRKRVKQPSLGVQLHVREPEAQTLEAVVGCGVAGVGATIDQPARRGREQAHERGEKRPNAHADLG